MEPKGTDLFEIRSPEVIGILYARRCIEDSYPATTGLSIRLRRKREDELSTNNQATNIWKRTPNRSVPFDQ
jgi:hypothetical protein